MKVILKKLDLCELVGELEQKTNNRFQNIDGYETYNNTIDVDYDSEGVIFTRWLYKLNTPEFSKVNRSQYGIGMGFKQDIFENKVKNC